MNWRMNEILNGYYSDEEPDNQAGDPNTKPKPKLKGNDPWYLKNCLSRVEGIWGMSHTFSDRGMNWLNEQKGYDTDMPACELLDTINTTIKSYHKKQSRAWKKISEQGSTNGNRTGSVAVSPSRSEEKRDVA